MNQEQAPVLSPSADDVIAAHEGEMQQPQESARLAALDMYVAAEALPDNADGPSVTKAGLSHEKVMAAGFSGYQEVREESKAWVAAADARDRVSDKELQDEAKAQAKAEGVAREAAYQEEMSSLRAGRDAANARVEGLSYKKKLENGGELGLKNNPALAAQLRAEAVAEAAEEGHNVGHLQPRHYEVVTDSAAEARVAEMAQLLKQHDAAMLAGRLSETTEAESNRANSSDSVIVPPITPSSTREQNDLNPDMSDFSTAESDKALDEHFDDVEALLLAEPLSDVSEQGKTKRRKGLMGKAAGLLAGMRMVEHPEYTSSAKNGSSGRSRAGSAVVISSVKLAPQRAIELFTNEETGKRNTVIAVVAGALLVGTVTWLSLKGLHEGSLSLGSGEKGQAVNDAAHPDVSFVVPPLAGGAGGHEMTKHVVQTLSGGGDTIWAHAQQQLETKGIKHPTPTQIYANTSRILKLNGLTWAQARELATGFNFKV
jgi:hypothetical protein